MPCRPLMLSLKVPEIISQKKISSSFLTLSRLSVFLAELPFFLSLFSAMLSPSLSLPSFASAELPSVKALATLSPFFGGGATFGLLFRKPETLRASHLVSLCSQQGYFVYPETFYRPESLDKMPQGWERLEAFEAFQKELLSWLFPFFCEAFPLAERLGEERFLSSCLPYSEHYEGKSLWLSLPNRKSAEGEA